MSCAHCGKTEAEQLLELADALLTPRRALIVLDGWPEELTTAAVLAVQLRQTSPSVLLRAIVEGWDRQRIVQELN